MPLLEFDGPAASGKRSCARNPLPDIARGMKRCLVLQMLGWDARLFIYSVASRWLKSFFTLRRITMFALYLFTYKQLS
jgi:hypothetical protein